MSFDSYDAKERVRQAVDIVDLVGSYVQLRREGRGYKAICPWHDDTRPSLQINPERQSFKCWVCDIGGDIFSFTMRQEGVDFGEALQLLADRAGISLKSAKPGQTAPAANPKRALYQAMQWAEEQFHQCLIEAPEAEAARRYLDDRGITESSIEQFHLGYAPDRWDWLQRRATGTPHSIATLTTVGLVGRTDSGRTYDRFKGRVLFSIRDSQNRPIALGGRVLPGADANTAKYINSPETPLFSKSNQLYGLDQARDGIRKRGAVLVMEGYTDCIVAHQFGWNNSVAVLGTALGERHIRLLQRYAEGVRIVLVLDGDEAGRRRANEILELFVAENANLQVLTLPDNLDPCDLLLERGSEEFGRLVDSSVDALTHAVNIATAGIDLQRDVHRATQALDHLLGMIAAAPRLRGDTTSEHRLREEKFLGRLAFDFHIPEETLRKQLSERRSQFSSKPVRARAEAAPVERKPLDTTLDPFERELLELLLLEPECVGALAEQLVADDLRSEVARRIFARCSEGLRAGTTVDFATLLLEFDEPEIKSLLVDCDELGRAKRERLGTRNEYDMSRCVKELLAAYRRREEEKQRRLQTAALRSSEAAGNDLEILQRLIDAERNRQGISVPTDG